MIPMSQYSLTQLENLAKSQDNEIALELIQRIDNSVDTSKGLPSEVPDFWDVENENAEMREVSFEKGKKEGIEEGKELGREEIIDKLRLYLFNQDFTDDNIDTFINEVMGA